MNGRLLVLASAGLAGLVLGTSSRSFQSEGVRAHTQVRITAVPVTDAPRGGQITQPEELLGAALGALLGEGDLRGLARLGTALAQLPATQVHELLDRLERTVLDSWDDRLAWLFSWWLKRDPEAAAGWVRPRLALAAQDGPLGYSFERSPRGQLILAWAKADPIRALDYAREHPGSGLAGQLLQVAIKSLPESDERARLALLLDFPVATRAGAMEVLLRDWTRREPSAALATVKAFADERERQKGAAEVLRTWGEKDPVAAFEQFQALALDQRDVLEELVRGLVKVAPERAVAWLQSLDGAQFGRWGPKVVERWAERDPAAALGFSLEHGISVGPRYESGRSRLFHDSLTRSSSGSHPRSHPLGKAMEEHPEATLAWLRSLPPGPERERITELAVMAAKDVDQSLLLFASLPAEAASRAAFNVARKFENDPTAGRKWAEGLPGGPVRSSAWAGLGSFSSRAIDLPPGADRDAMLSGLVSSTTGLNDPVFALEHALQITDLVLRRDVFEGVMETATDHVASRAVQIREWLEGSGVPEDWKVRWRAALNGVDQP